MTTTKKGFAHSTFTDAGTGETFEGGKAHDFAPGAYANYEAAGLIRPSEARTAAPATPRKAAPKKAAAKKAVPKPASAKSSTTPAPAPAPAPDSAAAE